MHGTTTESGTGSHRSTTPALTTPPPVATSLWHRVDEIAVLVRRNLIHMRRRPALLIFSLIEPVLLVLLFRFVFGGAVEMSIDTTYPNFMVPGILVQTVTLGAVTIGASLARDIYGGMLDRFRSLPIARASVLAGHTIAGLIRSLGVLLAMVATGALVGFRPTAGPAAWLAALALLLLCALAMAWVAALIALLVGGVEMVETLGLSLLFPLTLVSSAFVPVETMPGAVGAFAAHQPVTAVVDAVRALLLGQPAGTLVWVAAAWAVGTIAVFAPLSTMAYRRRTRH